METFVGSNQSTTIIDYLEQKCYLKPNFYKSDHRFLVEKIQEFTNWFNSTFRISTLHYSEGSEELAFILINLKRCISSAVDSILSQQNHQNNYNLTCKICGTSIPVNRNDWWGSLQNHEHFEQTISAIFCGLKDPPMINETAAPEAILVTPPETPTVNGPLNDTPQLTATVMAGSEAESKDILNAFPRVSLSKKADSSKASSSEFKFNFNVTYDPRIEMALYPANVQKAAQVIDKLKEYSIQKFSVSRTMCLLCRCYVGLKGKSSRLTPHLIKSHCFGQKHLRYANDTIQLNALSTYHSFWHRQEPPFQAHQAYFLPEDSHRCYCHTCQDYIKYSSMNTHIMGDLHRNKVLKMISLPDVHVELTAMQLEVYGIVMELGKMNVEKNNGKKKQRDPVANNTNPGNNTNPEQCVIIKSILDKTKDDQIILPNRLKQHQKFLKKSGNGVSCMVCNVTINDVDCEIKAHVLSLSHCNSSGILSDIVYKYFCDICRIRLPNEQGWDTHHENPLHAHTSLTEEKRSKLAEYECTTCHTIIYGDEEAVTYHIAAASRPRRKKKEVKLPLEVKQLFSSKDDLELEAVQMQLEANKVLECRNQMLQCSQDLQETISSIFPGCKAYLFGSRLSGLASQASDLDVFLDVGNMYNGYYSQDHQSQEQLVKKVSNLLKLHRAKYTNIVPIPSARTPIIKLRHRETNLDMDISFKHGLGVENTKFMKLCIDLQPTLQSFILILRRWSDYCKFNEHITHYAFSAVAIFYLQTQGHLLPVCQLKSLRPQSLKNIDGWDIVDCTSFADKLRGLVKPLNADCKDVLRDFFKYFSEFDFEHNVVCPLLGRTIPKSSFKDECLDDLPQEMLNYLLKVQQNEAERFRHCTPFCVQDPFDLSHNLTKACPFGVVAKFKTMCALTSEFLGTL